MLSSSLGCGGRIAKNDIQFHYYEIKNHQVVCNIFLKNQTSRSIDVEICREMFDRTVFE